MKRKTIFIAIFFGVGLAAALTIENACTGVPVSLRNVSAHLLAGLVGGIVFGIVIELMQNRNRPETK